MAGSATVVLVIAGASPSGASYPRDGQASRMDAHLVPVHKHAGKKTDPSTITITQANLKSGEAARKFSADVSTVLAQDPDFITYNEVPYRKPTALAPPPGYALWRTPGQYQGETPVAWRSSVWTETAEGTKRLSNRKGRLRGQHVDWGIRYANWVTLTSADGRTISIVSAHLAPVISITQGLQPKEVRNLGALVDSLAASGPVMVGGDFNMAYDSRSYLRTLFADYGMVPSYDALGTHFPTGNHHGATIDYLFLRQDPAAPVLTFTSHHANELYSDHNAVTAELTWTTPPPADAYRVVPGKVVSDPGGSRAARRAVLHMMVTSLDHAPEGASVHLTTTRLTAPALVAALDRAIGRGVNVQLILRSPKATPALDHFKGLLGHHATKSSFAIGCRTACQQISGRRHLVPTVLLISAVSSTPAVRIRADHAPTVRSGREVTSASVSVTKSAYDKAFDLFFRLAGRTI